MSTNINNSNLLLNHSFSLQLQEKEYDLNAPLLLKSDKFCQICNKQMFFTGIDFITDLSRKKWIVMGYDLCLNCGVRDMQFVNKLAEPEKPHSLTPQTPIAPISNLECPYFQVHPFCMLENKELSTDEAKELLDHISECKPCQNLHNEIKAIFTGSAENKPSRAELLSYVKCSMNQVTSLTEGLHTKFLHRHRLKAKKRMARAEKRIRELEKRLEQLLSKNITD